MSFHRLSLKLTFTENNQYARGTWLAQSVESGTLDLEVMSSSQERVYRLLKNKIMNT